ncbi:site-specific integrase [Zunongwangia profunda]|jgi:integrase|uniref:site-specific integrase n=1 Tax=Zunongwangia profunda TaxID=398743 RepID=UPI001D17F23D|nr:site-specific integrase [Zunongwangia profunda]MCC4228986.1 site-specific integrase [Zunongwangia profunda]|tara:strand:- start:894 stop:2120 length:1227 start_codon:yes stop_codon:yes gene_type:complete
MRTSKTFSILFWVYSSRVKNNQTNLYVRISLDNQRVNVSLKSKIPYDLWDATAQRLNGNSKLAKESNNLIDETRTKIFQNYQDLRFQNREVTAELLKANFLGEGPKDKTLVDILDYHAQKINGTLTKGTIRNFKVTENYIYRFLKEELHTNSIYLSELNYKFINDFSNFLFTYWPKGHINAMSHNTVMKHVQRLRKIVTLAFHLEWIDKDPFVRWKPTFEKKERDFLNSNELKIIEDFIFHNERLDRVRDLFIFSCYTGISFSDINQLTKDNIRIGLDGQKWIFTFRNKTKTKVKIPLLDKALELIEKYEDHPMTAIAGSLLPLITNVKVNFYLKEVAELCDIKRNLTFHMARHTFATTVTLANGVPIETVSKLLGHTKIATTQIYARVLEDKLSNDMSDLSEKLRNR